MDNRSHRGLSVGQTVGRGLAIYKKGLARMLALSFAGTLPQVWLGGLAVSHHAGARLAVAGLVCAAAVVWTNGIMVRYFDLLDAAAQRPSVGAMLGLAGAGDLLCVVTFLIWGTVVVVGTLLLVAPGVYVGNALLMLGLPVCFLERRRFFGSITRSLELTKGHWWKTCVVGAAAGAALLAPTLMVLGGAAWSTACAVAQGLEPLAAARQGASWVGGGASWAYLGVVAIAWPFFVAVSVVHYNSLRAEKEAAR